MEQILSFHRGPTGGMYHGTDIVSFLRGPTEGNVPWDRYCVIPQGSHRGEMYHGACVIPQGSHRGKCTMGQILCHSSGVPQGGNVPCGRYCVIPQGSHRGKCTMGRYCHSPGVPQGEMYHGTDIVSFLRGSTGGNVYHGTDCVIPQGSYRGKCTMGPILCHSSGVPQGEMYHGTNIVSFPRGPTWGMYHRAYIA